jgi:peptide-O-fucosyltransferase
MKMCYPSTEEIVSQLRSIAQTHKIASVFVGTDNDPLVREIGDALGVPVVSGQGLESPQVEAAIMGMGEVFIGNCVSSFTAMIKRQRDIDQKTSYFFGITKRYH